MKKLFIAALALATIVSCSKSDEPTVDSSRKSVSIKIENMTPSTRHESAPSNDTGGDLVCASNETLNVVFTNAANDRVVTLSFEDATEVANADGTWNYVFHALPESVKGFFVIGSRAAALDAASVTAAEEMWKASTQEGSAWDNVVVYGKCEDWEQDGTCDEGYNLFVGSVKVKPYKARIEISEISCSNLGYYNTDDNDMTIGYEKVRIDEIGFNGTIATTPQTLSANNQMDATANPKVLKVVPPTGKVWSWNVDPGTYPFYLEAYVESTFYNVVDKDRRIEANSYKEGDKSITTFESGHIYKMTVPFNESDLDDESSRICVDVTVEIAEWIVHHITPSFGN